MPGEVRKRGESIALRAVEPEDYEFLSRHWNNPGVRGFTRSDPSDADDIADFIESSSRSLHLLPCRNDEPVGFLWLFRLDDFASRGEVAFWIAPDEQGKGYATEAGTLGVEYAFEERDLNRVTARVFEGNDASMRVLEKVGFEREGRLREHYYIGGEFVDAHLFGVLADEW
jgi:RimJ/RimL family protein N-acetyltransferase